MWVPSLLRQSFRMFGATKQSPSGYIGTHNGKFHCDEVFACWMLKLLPEFKNHLILRFVLRLFVSMFNSYNLELVMK